MANYIEDSNLKLDWAMPFQRTGKFPLDRSSMFSSYEDAVKYAKGDITDPDERELCGSSYIGQLICVYENDEVIYYKINADRTLSSINSYVSATDEEILQILIDSNMIMPLVNEDGAILVDSSNTYLVI